MKKGGRGWGVELWGHSWEYGYLFFLGAEYVSDFHITLPGFLYICNFIKNGGGQK